MACQRSKSSWSRGRGRVWARRAAGSRVAVSAKKTKTALEGEEVRIGQMGFWGEMQAAGVNRGRYRCSYRTELPRAQEFGLSGGTAPAQIGLRFSPNLQPRGPSWRLVPPRRPPPQPPLVRP